jgi:hypothetical protein
MASRGRPNDACRMPDGTKEHDDCVDNGMCSL